MAYYERLSALDAAFLDAEDDNAHMHVGATLIFDAPPVAKGARSVDIERIRTYIESRLALIPRYRQRLAFVPFEGRPVWVDDARFNIHYHVRHTSLPYPGDIRQLKRLAGRIASQQLDRGKPLWEIWVVEGLENNRFAIITKAHHCMIDGIAGIDLMAVILTASPKGAVGTVDQWRPRPAPSPQQLLAEESLRRLAGPFTLVGGAARMLLEPRQALGALWDGAASLVDMVRVGVPPASLTPVNPLQIGPHRRFDWVRLDLDNVKTVKNRLGGTVNDVVLATAAGALRQYFLRHGLGLDGLDFRAAVPVSTRPSSDRGSLGNKVATLLARLPIGEGDPRRRLESVVKTTMAAKNSKQGGAAEVLAQVSDWTVGALMAQVMRLSAWLRTYNILITNIPGPQMPLYLLGAELREAYPIVPIFGNQAIGIGLFSYAGSLFWGANADWDAIPDLHDLVNGLDVEFETLRATAAPAAAHVKVIGRTATRRRGNGEVAPAKVRQLAL